MILAFGSDIPTLCSPGGRSSVRMQTQRQSEMDAPMEETTLTGLDAMYELKIDWYHPRLIESIILETSAPRSSLSRVESRTPSLRGMKRFSDVTAMWIGMRQSSSAIHSPALYRLVDVVLQKTSSKGEDMTRILLSRWSVSLQESFSKSCIILLKYDLKGWLGNDDTNVTLVFSRPSSERVCLRESGYTM